MANRRHSDDRFLTGLVSGAGIASLLISVGIAAVDALKKKKTDSTTPEKVDTAVHDILEQAQEDLDTHAADPQ